jgi:hypothetical protein
MRDWEVETIKPKNMPPPLRMQELEPNMHLSLKKLRTGIRATLDLVSDRFKNMFETQIFDRKVTTKILWKRRRIPRAVYVPMTQIRLVSEVHFLIP